MNFDQYINNPLGKNNAVFSQRNMFKELYQKKFDQLLLREAGKINYQLFYDKENDKYYIHILIPSEVVPKFYYDVVIMFYSNDPSAFSSSSLSKYDIKVFSNDPSFCFTYLRVFLKNDMFFEDLKNKAPKLALKEDPKVRNPHEIIGYVKSLYFAYLFMKLKNLFNKTWYKMNGLRYDKKLLLSNVVHADEKIYQRQEEEKRLKTEEKKKSKKEIQEKERKQTSNRSNISKPKSRISTPKKSNIIKPKKKISGKTKSIGRRKNI